MGERKDPIVEVYKSSAGYDRGLTHAEQLFTRSQDFDADVIGSQRIRVLEGQFIHEVIVRGEGGKPTSKLLSLALGIQVIELLEAIPYEMNQVDYHGHLVGFSERYSGLLAAKHAETLDQLGITGTMAAAVSS